jgi:hypothetical protein
VDELRGPALHVLAFVTIGGLALTEQFTQVIAAAAAFAAARVIETLKDAA